MRGHTCKNICTLSVVDSLPNMTLVSSLCPLDGADTPACLCESWEFAQVRKFQHVRLMHRTLNSAARTAEKSDDNAHLA
jgi:hypothetical protein